MLVLVLVVSVVIGSLVLVLSRQADTATRTVQQALLASAARCVARSALNMAAIELENSMNLAAYNTADRFAAVDATYQVNLRADGQDLALVEGLRFSPSVASIPVQVFPVQVQSPNPWGVVGLRVTVTATDVLGNSVRRTVEEARVFSPRDGNLGMDAQIRVAPVAQLRWSAP